MIPEVAKVVDAACAYVDAALTPDTSKEWAALLEAVEAYKIRASRPAGAVTYEETDRTWGEVVAGDEILSEKTHRWYEVSNSVRTPEGKAKINIKGSPKPITRDPGDPVRVKRGVLGDAADTLDLLWSGTHTLGAWRGAEPSATNVGPMILSHEETQETLSEVPEPEEVEG